MSEPIRFRDRLLQQPTRQLWNSSDDLWRYREAASVLASFDFDSLNATGGITSPKAKNELLADCDIAAETEGKVCWSLRASVRRAALRRLLASPGSITNALASNPDRAATRTQKLLESCLTGGDLRTWNSSSPEESRALLTVTEWLTGISELQSRLPTADDVKQKLAWEQLLQPFRQLVGTTFAGRQNELDILSDYVGVFEASRVREVVARVVEQVFSIRTRPPLFINGPGGCGKSTLISSFILAHANVSDNDRFPFAYLDFDRPGLVAEEPITLLTEVMRQLSIEFPDSEPQYRTLRDLWSVRIAQQFSPENASTEEAPAVAARFRLNDRDAFLAEFSNFVNGLKGTNQPLLLVLDTFEEVQFRSAAFAEEVLDFLEVLQSRVPRLRTVLSGRADIRSKKYRMRTVAIDNFDREAGVAVLMKYGIRDAAVAQTIYEQVGGSPLVLRLAADVAKIEHVDQSGIDGLPTGWLSVFSSQSIEVVLYKRILSHIYDPRVQQLAYPGLVLRVITPDVLQEVLSKACNVTVESPHDAEELIATMQGQLATILVPSAGDEHTLVHRPDMRSILLSDLRSKSEKDKAIAEKLRGIHQAAIRYYETRDGLANRAEEIYHRLALGVERSVLGERWQPGLNPYLGSSIRELPEASQIYVAARLGIELPDSLWAKADDQDWVLYAARAATQKTELGRSFEALDIVARRPQLYDDPTLRPVIDRVAFDIFHHYGRQYEEIRETQNPGDARTRNMDGLVSTVSGIGRGLPRDRTYAPRLFAEQTPGSRVMALAVAITWPYPEHMDIAIACIRDAVSPFEQYHALRLARRTFTSASEEQRTALRNALQRQTRVRITRSDPSRYKLREELLEMLDKRDAR